MRLRDSPSAYGTVSRLNHWLGAALLLSTLCIGLYFTGLEPGGARIFWRTLHIAIGTILLPLVAFRLCWRLATPAPLPLAQAPALRLLARAVHLLLLLLVVAQLASGVLMQWFDGRPIGVFRLLRIASPLQASELWHDRMELLHGVLAWTLLATLAVHLLAVLVHGLRDAGAGRRMAGRPRDR